MSFLNWLAAKFQASTPALSTSEGSVECASPSGKHVMRWVEWGDPANKDVLICVHGVSRQGRDFDVLARAMRDRYRVICPDIAGRGRSDWLKVAAEYAVPQYAADCMSMIRSLGPLKRVDWVGTSMGGLIGMGIASQPGSPITKLLLNDVGPVIQGLALGRIGDYLGADIRFKSVEDGIAYLKSISASFGPHSDAQWRAFSLPMLVEREEPGENGSTKFWRLHYDPSIGENFRTMAKFNPTGADMLLWEFYDPIRCDTMVVRGAESDLLSREVFEEMARRGPKARSVEIAGVGHAPTLVQADQVAIVREFLLDRTRSD
jgi:pimeloyl-ACP methyl ester carboxylesterase